MGFGDFQRTAVDSVFTISVDGAGPKAIDSVVITDGGDGYMVGDVITPDMTAATGTSLTITVTSIDETGYSTGLSGVGKITGITYTDSGDFVDADDGDYTFDASTLTGVGSDFVDHVVYEDGGTIPEYVDGTGLDFTVDTDGSGIVTAVNTIVDGGVNYQEGTLVRVFESGVDVVPAIFEITTVDASGTVSALTLIDGGSGYTASQVGLAVDEVQNELKTTGPEVLWLGTLTGVYDPSAAPDTANVYNDPRITVVRKADAPQLAIQKRYIDGGSVVVYAEPTLINSDGREVGNNLRAEQIFDRERCEGNGFIWEVGTTGDADAGDYGYCRELLAAEVTDAASDFDCPAGSFWDGGTGCTEYTNSAADATAINGTVATNGKLRAMRDCEVAGSFWDVTTDTCIAGDTPGNFSIGTFTFGSPTPGQTQNIYTSERDYLANACRNLGYVWNYDDNTCNATVDPSTLTTQVLCTDAGYIWIAGTCYNPNDFGDGHSRNSTYQEDPNDAPA